MLLGHIIRDVRSTSSNLRKILLEIGKYDIFKISRSVLLKVEFAKLTDEGLKK